MELLKKFYIRLRTEVRVQYPNTCICAALQQGTLKSSGKSKKIVHAESGTHRQLKWHGAEVLLYVSPSMEIISFLFSVCLSGRGRSLISGAHLAITCLRKMMSLTSQIKKMCVGWSWLERERPPKDEAPWIILERLLKRGKSGFMRKWIPVRYGLFTKKKKWPKTHVRS